MSVILLFITIFVIFSVPYPGNVPSQSYCGNPYVVSFWFIILMLCPFGSLYVLPLFFVFWVDWCLARWRNRNKYLLSEKKIFRERAIQVFRACHKISSWPCVYVRLILSWHVGREVHPAGWAGVLYEWYVSSSQMCMMTWSFTYFFFSSKNIDSKMVRSLACYSRTFHSRPSSGAASSLWWRLVLLLSAPLTVPLNLTFEFCLVPCVVCSENDNTTCFELNWTVCTTGPFCYTLVSVNQNHCSFLCLIDWLIRTRLWRTPIIPPT